MGHIYYRPSESRYCTSCLRLCGSDEPNRTLPCLLLWRSDLSSSSSSDEARGSCWSPNIIIVSVCLRTDRASLVDRIFCCSFTLAVVIVLACDSSVSVTLNWTTPNRTKYLRNSTTHEFRQTRGSFAVLRRRKQRSRVNYIPSVIQAVMWLLVLMWFGHM